MKSASDSSARRAGTSGRPASWARACSAYPRTVSRARLSAADSAQQVERLGHQGVVGDRPGAEDLAQPGRRRCRRRRRPARRAPAASARPRAGRCRGSCPTRRTSTRCRAGRRRAGRRRRSCRRRRPGLPLWTARRAAEHRPEPGRGADQGAGLVGDHPQVVLDRVGLARPDRLGDLTAHQPGERARLDPHRLRAEVGGDVGGPGEQVVAGEDRDRVAPAGVGRRGTAADRGLVHHVVVVERGQVGQLDHHGGQRRRSAARGSPNWAASATSSGRNRLPPASMRWRATSLSTGSAVNDRVTQCGLDRVQTGPDLLFEGRVVEGDAHRRADRASGRDTPAGRAAHHVPTMPHRVAQTRLTPPGEPPHAAARRPRASSLRPACWPGPAAFHFARHAGPGRRRLD